MNKEKLEKEIEDLQDYLPQLSPKNPEYKDTVEVMDKLNRMSEGYEANKKVEELRKELNELRAEVRTKPKWYEDRDLLKTIIVVVGELTAVILTLKWEELHVLTSRALGFFKVRPKL